MGKPEHLVRRQARQVVLQQQHKVGQEPALRHRQGFALHRLENVRNAAEMVARQEKLEAVVVVGAGDAHLLAQGQDEGCAARGLERRAANLDIAGAVLADGDGPVVDRAAAYDRSRSADRGGRRAHTTDREPVQAPVPIRRQKAIR
jgi:hypothetical protein